MGDVIQFRDYGHRPAKPVNHEASLQFWIGHYGRDGKGAIAGQPYRDDIEKPEFEPGMVSDSGDCA
jgi:hypothetical protein